MNIKHKLLHWHGKPDRDLDMEIMNWLLHQRHPELEAMKVKYRVSSSMVFGMYDRQEIAVLDVSETPTIAGIEDVEFHFIDYIAKKFAINTVGRIPKYTSNEGDLFALMNAVLPEETNIDLTIKPKINLYDSRLEYRFFSAGFNGFSMFHSLLVSTVSLVELINSKESER